MTSKPALRTAAVMGAPRVPLACRGSWVLWGGDMVRLGGVVCGLTYAEDGDVFDGERRH